jgi:folate-dependent phosphoribosylglycinamide formyltransferase PurN
LYNKVLDKYKPNVVFLTRPFPDSMYIANKMHSSDHLNLTAIVAEERTQGQFDLLRRKVSQKWKKYGALKTLGFLVSLPYLYWQDRLMLRAQLSAWYPGRSYLPPKMVPYKTCKNLNSTDIEKFLISMDADYLVVYGTRILKSGIYLQAKYGAINIHVGITPEYRGSKSEFWALYEKKYDLVGVTIHMIDEGVDTGEVILQKNTLVACTDDEISLRIKNVEVAVKLLEKAIVKMDCNIINKNISLGVNRNSGFYSTPSVFQYLSLHLRLKLARHQRSNHT